MLYFLGTLNPLLNQITNEDDKLGEYRFLFGPSVRTRGSSTHVEGDTHVIRHSKQKTFVSQNRQLTDKLCPVSSGLLYGVYAISLYVHSRHISPEGKGFL